MQLRELDLHLRLARAGTRREDVENELRTVHHAPADGVLEVLPLRRRELVIEDGDRRVGAANELGELVNLAAAEICRRMRAVELLRELADNCRAGGVGEEGQLAEVLAGRVAVWRALERGADEDDALLLRREGDQVPGDEPDSRIVRVFSGCRRVSRSGRWCCTGR